jgi:hypothetical protein
MCSNIVTKLAVGTGYSPLKYGYSQLSSAWNIITWTVCLFLILEKGSEIVLNPPIF